MKDAWKSIDRKKMSRMQLIRDAQNGQCVEGCNRHWVRVRVGSGEEQQYPSCFIFVSP